MSDINITLSASDAITEANALKAALDRIETRANRLKNFLIKGSMTLQAQSLAKDMNAIQSLVSNRPIFARVLLRLDKRTLSQKWLKGMTLNIDTSVATLKLDQIIAKLKMIKTMSRGGFVGDPASFSGGTFKHPGPGVKTAGMSEKRLSGEEELIKKLKRQDAAYKGHETRLKNIAASERERKLGYDSISESQKKLISNLKTEDAIVERKRAATQKMAVAEKKAEDSILSSQKKRTDFLTNRENQKAKILKGINIEQAKTSVIENRRETNAKKLTSQMYAQLDALKAVHKATDFQTKKLTDQQHVYKDIYGTPRPKGLEAGEDVDYMPGDYDKLRGNEKEILDFMEEYKRKTVKNYKEAEALQRSLSDRAKVAQSTAGRQIGGVDFAPRYEELASKVSGYKKELEKGTMSQKKFDQAVARTRKNMTALDKQHRNLNKTVRQGRGFFMNFTMALTAIAAAMFIWQKLKQTITSVVSTGDELSQTFAKMRAESDMLTSSSGAFLSTFTAMSKGTSWGITEMYGAYKELKKQGVDTNEALKQIIPTLKIARNEDLDLAKAADIAAHNTLGLRDQYLRLDKEVSKTGGESWKRLKKSMDDVFKSAYMKAEPHIIKVLNDLSDWVRLNENEIADAFRKLVEIGTDLASAFIKMAAGIAKFLEVGANLIGFGKNLTELEKAEERLGELQLRRLTILKELDQRITGQREYAPEMLPELMNYDIDIRLNDEQLRKKLAKISIEITKLQDKIKSLKFPEAAETGAILPTYDEQMEALQSLYDKSGEMSDRFYAYRLDKIKEFGDAQMRIWDAIHDSEAKRLTQLAMDTEKYNLKWQNLARYMQEYQAMFELTGIMDEKYYKRRLQKISDETSLYSHLNQEQKKNLEFLMKRAVYNEKMAALAEPHEKVFEQTGVMTDWLKLEKERKAASDYHTKTMRMAETGDYSTDAWKAYQIELIKIETDYYAKRLENQEAYFSNTGMATNSFVELQMSEYDRLMKSMMLQGMDPKDATANFKEMAEVFIDNLIQPLGDAWQDYYSMTNKMSEQQIAIENRSITRQYEHMAKVLEDEEAAWEWYTHAVTQQHIKILESHDDMCDGITAGWLRVQEEIETLSKQISDDVVAGIDNIESAWKDLFMDVMTDELDSWEDYVISILGAVRDTFNEILWDMVKNWIKNTTLMKSLDKLLGGGKEATQRRAEEALAMKAQNIALTEQVGLVAALTAEYSALAIAMAACGFGSFGSGGDQSAWKGLDWIGTDFHKGGEVGVDSGRQRSFPASMFYNAPKLHSGLSPDEYPAILKKHEVVFTPKQLEGMQNVIANDTIKQLSSLKPAVEKESKGDINTISINVPVSVDANTKLASRLRTEVEELIHSIMREEMR